MMDSRTEQKDPGTGQKETGTAQKETGTKTLEMICTVCPTGCALTVTVENGEVVKVVGNACKRGIPHAKAEATHPVRTLTTTVRLCGADRPLLPVRSNRPVPKPLLREMVRVLNGVTVSAPVEEGSIILADILGTGADIVASRPVRRV